MRVHLHAALAAAEGQAHQRALHGHQERQRLYLVEVDRLVEPDRQDQPDRLVVQDQPDQPDRLVVALQVAQFKSVVPL